MPQFHKDPGLFVSEEAMVTIEPLTPELLDHVALEDEEIDGVITPVTPLEDPREGSGV